MHPLISAWYKYLKLAELQFEYGNPYYSSWISACIRAKKLIKELERAE